MGDEADAQARRRALAAYRVDDALLDRALPEAFAMHDLPRTLARRSHPRSSTDAASGSGIRLRTADMRRRRCSNGSSRRGGRAPEPRRRARAGGRLARLRRRRRRAPRGYVIFVDGALPGDRVRARVHHRKRAYAQARVTALIEPGPDRVPAQADHPGAPWQELRYERQLEIKQAQVDDALRRIGHLDDFALHTIVPASSSGATATSSSTRSDGRRTASLRSASTSPAHGSASSRSTIACSPRRPPMRRARQSSTGATRRSLRRLTVARTPASCAT